MTASSRPNLGGLFNGSQPPTRPGRVNGVTGPTLVPPPAVSIPSKSTAELTPGPAPTDPAPPRALPGWADPVRAVEQYFALLHTLLDINRDVAVACTRAIISLPQRVGIRR